MFWTFPALAQCMDIETIFVDSCDDSGDEGFNEMVAFHTGPTALNVSAMNVNWPSQSWQGLIQNGFTTGKVNSLNAQVAALGGCGRFLQPAGGVIPANAEVILITSQNFSLTANVFGALSHDVYILFQDNTTVTAGHFGNYGAASAIRTLTISFGGCSDTVSYDRSLLIDASGLPGAGNGATVHYNSAGAATYTNDGCVAPVDVFSVDAGSPVTVCAGGTINLTGTAQGQASVSWSAPSGTFSNSNSLTTSYTLPFSASGSVTLTLTATNSCGNSISDTVTVTINNATVPTFTPVSPICAGDALAPLPTTSLNGVTGTWSPALDNLNSGTYNFSPATGQCASPATMTITVNPKITPTFTQLGPICFGTTAPSLPAASLEGISGTWSPTVIDNQNSNTYNFLPGSGQCANAASMSITVTSGSIAPDFSPTLTLCSGDTAPALNVTSPNGISGVWSPSVISNTANGTYLFTPNPGQCATNFTLTVNVTSATIVPDFTTPINVCSGSTPPVLNATSPNGISGVWSPSVISNTANGTYVFTPNPGQCGTIFTLTVNVTSATVVPDFTTSINVCSGTTPPVLNATSPNGISGAWSPSVIDNTTGNSYIFTPNSGQCATILTLTVNITPPTVVPTFNSVAPICRGGTLSPLPTTSLNGITGSWSPALDNTQNQTYTFTPNAGQCALSTQLSITVNPPTVVPVFASSSITICNGDSLSPLPTTSLNGIIGSWSPALDNTQNQTYTFTPNPGQCALNASFTINVTQKTVPTFAPVNAVCAGSILSPLPTTSLNGINGTWSPALDNTQTRTYTFTPTSGQCATAAQLTITINSGILPVFSAIAPVCEGTIVNPLPTTSLNGITGTWSPAFDNLQSQNYTFTPNPGQCAVNGSLSITVSPNPVFAQTAYICFGQGIQVIQPATLDSDLSISDYTFIWTQDGNPLTDVTPSIQAVQTGTYEVVATHRVTNCIVTITFTVLASPTATAIAYVNEDFADVQQIIVEVTGGLGDFMYQLNYGPFQPSNVFTITQGGDYTINVKDNSGCNNFELHVTALNYPKYFTPNDDGYNDTWNVAGLQPGQNGTITIFDRYGKLLKQFKANSDGWNGTFNGKPLPSTDYWFVIDYQTVLGVSKTFRSHFSLKR